MGVYEMGTKNNNTLRHAIALFKLYCASTTEKKAGVGGCRNKYFTQDQLSSIIVSSIKKVKEETDVIVSYNIHLNEVNMTNGKIIYSIIISASSVDSSIEESYTGEFQLGSGVQNILPKGNLAFATGAVLSYIKRYIVIINLSLGEFSDVNLEDDIKISNETKINSFKPNLTVTKYKTSKGMIYDSREEAVAIISEIAKQKDDPEAFIENCLRTWANNYNQSA
jgi:hypothetical protein